MGRGRDRPEIRAVPMPSGGSGTMVGEFGAAEEDGSVRLISGKELFDSYHGLGKAMENLERTSRRMLLPRWKRRIIRLCERVIARLDK